MKDVKILIPLTEVTLGADGRGSVTVSVILTGESKERVVLTAVSPPGGAPMAAGPQPATAPQPIEAWTTIERPLREITAGVVEQYLVTFDGSQLAAGRFPVLLIAFPADEAPEEYADRGQTVTVIIPAEGTPPPPPPWKIPWLLIAIAATVLVLVLGVGGYFVFRTPNVEVPGVTGLAQQAAVDKLTKLGFAVGVSETTYKDLDVVAKQDPAPGQIRKKGSQVNLLVDHGAVVPDLTNLSSAAALQKLTAAGLKMQAQPVPGVQPFDVVIGQSVAGGAKAAKAATIIVKVRVGVLVPQVVNCSFESARRILTAQGFQLTVSSIVSSAPLNQVVNENPNAGQVVELGSSIHLDLSGFVNFGTANDCDVRLIKPNLDILKDLHVQLHT